MKVCHVLNNVYPYFAAPYEYSRKLAAMGIDVQVICRKGIGQTETEVIDGVRVLRLDVDDKVKHYSLSVAFSLEAAKIVKQAHYDVLHVYSFRWSSFFVRLCKGHFKHSVLDIRSASVSSNNVRAKMSDLITRFESYSFDHLIVLNQEVGCKIFGNNRHFDVVPLGVDLDKFQPIRDNALREKLGFLKNEMILVFVGNLSTERQVHILVSAVAGLCQTSELPLKLFIVGDGPELERLQQQSRSLACEKNIIFMGRIPYEAIQQYIAIGDVGLSFIPKTDNFYFQPPLKTVEYMACGLPTIATDTQGNQIFITDRDNGILIDDTIDGVQKGLQLLLEDKALFDKIQSNSRRSIEQFDWKQIVGRDLLPVYEKLLRHKHKILIIRRTALDGYEIAYTHYLIQFLSQTGYDVAIISPERGIIPVCLSQLNVTIKQVPLGKLWFFEVQKFINQFQPDIVHTFLHTGCCLYPLLSFSNQSKHLLDIRSPLLRTGWKRKLMQFKNRLESLCYQHIASHSIASAYTVMGHKKGIHFLPPGVELKAVSPRDKIEINSPLKMIYIGSMDEKRSVSRLITIIISAMESVNFTLDLYGSGNDWDNIKRLISESDKSDKIRLNPAMLRRELFKSLPKYDVGIAYIPHQLYDTAPPLKTMEYLASGLAVLGTDTTGNKLFVESGVNGLLVEEGNESFKQGIIDIVQAPWLKEAKSIAPSTVTSFDWDTIFKEKLIPLYQQMLK
ncbi:MAG: glycosyltransferase [Gammaproteobacteria bacterium]|nr:glycosyltransferase [Gammaproteobacteria bacterium]